MILAEQFACEPLDGIRVLERTTVVAIHDGNYVLAVERGRRLWKIRAKRIVLATGALERPPVVADNDRPGLMLSGAAAAYGNPDGVTPVSGGWSPRVHLWSQARGRLRWDDRIGAPVPDGELAAVEVAGRVTGAGLPDAPAFALPDDEDAAFVDLERDSTVADVRRAVGAGLGSVEHVKRFTTIGTGSDQGKTANVNAIRVAAELLGVHPGELGTTTFRPPYTPVSFALVAGRDRGALFDPVRTTPIHAWHLAHGAVMENVGQWHRPRYFPRGGETMDEAVLRECAAVREHVGIQDVSTLGKIDLQGPDAVEFLNRMYTNAFDSLAVGRARYALMCKPDGMVFDDGVVMRVGEQRFLATTTTGNAARVLDHMEEYLQTEWPELRVWLTSVTEQWATVAVAGPDSRDLLQRLTAIPLDNESLPFMAIAEGEVAGIPARVVRVSFSGELAFEVNVDGRRGLELWEAIARRAATRRRTAPRRCTCCAPRRATRSSARTPTARSRRTTSAWTGSSRRQKPEFLGKRSFARADTSRPDRKQLVGLLPLDRETVLAEGAQLTVAAGRARDARPRHVELPQRGARAAVRAGAAAQRPRADRRDRVRERRRGRGDRSRCSTTGRERAAMAVLTEPALPPQVDVRGAPPPGFPTEPNTTAEVGGATVLWLGPDEWLVLGATEADFPDAAAAVDVSANRVAFELAGDGRAGRAREGLCARPRPLRAGRVRADAARPRAGDPAPARRRDLADPRAPVVRSVPARLARGRALRRVS